MYNITLNNPKGIVINNSNIIYISDDDNKLKKIELDNYNLFLQEFSADQNDFIISSFVSLFSFIL